MSWLTRRAEEAVKEIGCEACHAYGDDKRLADAIAKVVREFADRVAKAIVEGRSEKEGWALDIWGGDPDRDPERFVVDEALAAAEREP